MIGCVISFSFSFFEKKGVELDHDGIANMAYVLVMVWVAYMTLDAELDVICQVTLSYFSSIIKGLFFEEVNYLFVFGFFGGFFLCDLATKINITKQKH